MSTTPPIDPYELFLTAIKTPATKKAYEWALEQYLQYCKLSDYPELLQGEIADIENKVLQYVLYTNQESMSKSMQNIRLCAVRLFYDVNNKSLNWGRLLRLKNKKTIPPDDIAYTKEQIITMLKNTDKEDYRTRAIILILATSGMRIGALTEIKLGDLHYLPEQKLLSIKVYKGQPEEYDTFVTTEATKQIFQYLKTRYKTLTDLPKDDYLITNAFYPKCKTIVESLSNTVREIAIKTGIRTEDGDKYQRKEIALNHGFRKFFNTVLVKTDNLKPIWSEKLLGHKMDLQHSYLKPTVLELYEEYKKAIPALTFHFDNPLVKPL